MLVGGCCKAAQAAISQLAQPYPDSSGGQDIPGVFYGTLLQRLDRLFLPGFLKRFIRNRLLASRRRKLAQSDRCVLLVPAGSAQAWAEN